MLLLSFVLVGFLINAGFTGSVPEPSACPTWFHRPNSQNNDCVCGDVLNWAIYCDEGSGSVHLVKSFCMFFSNEINTTLSGTCPYSDGGTVPRNVSGLKDFGGLCFKFY